MNTVLSCLGAAELADLLDSLGPGLVTAVSQLAANLQKKPQWSVFFFYFVVLTNFTIGLFTDVALFKNYCLVNIICFPFFSTCLEAVMTTSPDFSENYMNIFLVAFKFDFKSTNVQFFQPPGWRMSIKIVIETRP